MPTLTADQKASILSAMNTLGLANASVFIAANGLNAPTRTANSSAPAIPAPFTWQDMRAALSPASKANLVGMGPSFTRVLDLIDGMERAKLLGWVADLLTFAKITSTESTALNTILNATHADPDWPAYLYGPSAFDAIAKASPIVISGVPYMFCTEQMITEARS